MWEASPHCDLSLLENKRYQERSEGGKITTWSQERVSHTNKRLSWVHSAHMKKLGMVAHACNGSAVVGEMGESLRLTGQLV